MGILGALGGAMTGGMGSVAGGIAGRAAGGKPQGPKGPGAAGGIADQLRGQPMLKPQPVPIPGATGMPPPALATKPPSDMQQQGRTAPDTSNQPMGGGLGAARILGRRGSSF